MSKKPIEPKPTTYQGQLFRSRLEARWAVYFDHTPNILTWAYEPHLIKFKNGWTYTPDFLLTIYVDGKRQQLYVECKPAAISDDYDSFLQRISRETQHGIFLVMSNMFNDTEIRSRLYVAGKSHPVSLSELFVDPQRAYERAINYRFDLKGH